MRILILGIGNPILGDDGVGNYVSKKLKEKIPEHQNFIIKDFESTGLDLVEEILDFDIVYLIDSIVTKKKPIGTITRMKPEDFEVTIRSANLHSLSFPDLLKRIRISYPKRVPEDIRIFVIEIEGEYIFTETISPTVKDSAHQVVKTILSELLEEKHIK
ncbi:MAG: hydrogenase maturation protease [Candidatus Ranarchaeia archaeon]